jgi:hypothetical protein
MAGESIVPSLENRIASETIGEQHQLLLQAWECAFADDSVIYLSGPLNTGPRFVDWYRHRGRSIEQSKRRYSQEHRRSVLQPNSRDLKAVADRLRVSLREPVLEPASLKIADWSQKDYAALWARVIQRFVHHIVLMPGWEFSSGCSAEVVRGFQSGIPLTDVDGSPISFEYARERLQDSVAETARDGVPLALSTSLSELLSLRPKQQYRVPPSSVFTRRKDAVLDELAKTANVAQFISFSPRRGDVKQEFARVLGFPPNHRFENLDVALESLLQNSVERSINIRSFIPNDPRSCPFKYGLKSISEAAQWVRTLSSEGLHTIANETVDKSDGGVSGVVMGDIIEFGPDDTPRIVEKDDVATLPRGLGIELLSIVYGFLPDLQYPRDNRVEFSIHPQRRGWKHTNTLCWELTSPGRLDLKSSFMWPNRFSRMIGDKVFGLLIAHLLGVPVPRTSAIARRVKVFTFGRETGNSEIWTRTCPREQVPGKFTTTMGWTDPFALLQDEDPNNKQISSVLCQNAISAEYSGAAVVTADDRLVIEGIAGWGDNFMRGQILPHELPLKVTEAIKDLYSRLQAAIGPVRFEWVFDGETVWVVQLHKGKTQSVGNWLVPGNAEKWVHFNSADNPSEALNNLRSLVQNLEPGTGIVLSRSVGLTSHLADIIRRAGIPARLT